MSPDTELNQRWRLVCLLIGCEVIAFALWFLQPMLWVSVGKSPTSAAVVRDKLEPVRAASNAVLFVGDTYFGESYAESPEMSAVGRRGYDQPLGPFRELLKSASVVVGNLEAPLTQIDSWLSYLKYWPHKGDPEASAAALHRAGFDALSLANNHAWDAMSHGLRDTRAALQSEGIAVFGAGPSLVEAARPLRIDLDAGGRRVRLAVIGVLERQWDDFFSGAYATRTTGGTYPLAPRAVANQIRELKRADPELWVIAYPHWGPNYQWRTRRQARAGRALLAVGADLVIGHGAHAFQEVELTDEGAILYSLGNFVFLSNGRYQQKNIHPWSAAARIEFTADGDAINAGLKLYFIASDNLLTGFRPHLLDGAAFDRAAERLLSGGSLGAAARERLRTAARAERDRAGRHLALDLGRAGR